MAHPQRSKRVSEAPRPFYGGCPKVTNMQRSKAGKKKVSKKKSTESQEEKKVTGATLFASAQPEYTVDTIPKMSETMAGMVETTFEMEDPEATYQELLSALDKRRDALTPGVIREQLSDSARLYRNAHRLYIVARHDQERFDNENTIFMATLREEAKSELEAEKSVGKLKKAITDADVVARISRAYPDVYEEMNDRAIRARKMVEHLKHLVDVFKNRMRALATLAGTREEL